MGEDARNPEYAVSLPLGAIPPAQQPERPVVSDAATTQTGSDRCVAVGATDKEHIHAACDSTRSE